MGLLPQFTVLLQAGIGIGLQLGREPRFQRLAVDGHPPRQGFGPHMALVSSLFHVAFDRSLGDAYGFHNLLAWFALVDGTQDSVS